MIECLQVHGDSMAPSLITGDFVIISHCYRSITPQDVVVVNHPDYGRMIKRVMAVSPVGCLRLIGDGPHSVSSAAMGWIKPEAIIGKVWWVISPQQGIKRMRKHPTPITATAPAPHISR